jgi:periplasmic divalent cation tolerance protein
MTDKIVVIVTGGSVRECKKIARALIEQKLIACANIVPAIRSLYVWKKKIADEKECLMLLKTTRDHLAALHLEVEKLHSYSVPEVIALPIIDGSPNYLNWIGESVGPSEPMP